MWTLWEPPGARFFRTARRQPANVIASIPSLYRGGEYVAGRARTRASGRPGTRVARDRLDRIRSVHPAGRVRGVVGAFLAVPRSEHWGGFKAGPG